MMMHGPTTIKFRGITRLVLRNLEETTPTRTTLIKKQMSLWRNKFFRRLQRKVSNEHKLKIFLSFDCQSVTHGLPDTWSPNTKWQKKPPFEDWKFKEVKAEVHWNYMNTSVPTPPQTHCVPIIETNWLMLFREIVPIYCENYTQLINTLCGKDAEHYMD